VITGCAKVSRHHLETMLPIEQPFDEFAAKIAGAGEFGLKADRLLMANAAIKVRTRERQECPKTFRLLPTQTRSFLSIKGNVCIRRKPPGCFCN